MSKRTKLVLITLTWTVAVILGVLPWIWPWYSHLIGTRTGQAYEFEVAGFVVGYMTKSVMSARRRKA